MTGKDTCIMCPNGEVRAADAGLLCPQHRAEDCANNRLIDDVCNCHVCRSDMVGIVPCLEDQP